MSEQEEKAPDLINEMVTACEEPSRGRIFVLMGPNGAGKTRFLQSIGGRFGGVNARTLYLRSDRVLRGSGDVGAEANAKPNVLSKMLDQDGNAVDITSAFYWLAQSVVRSDLLSDDDFTKETAAWLKSGNQILSRHCAKRP